MEVEVEVDEEIIKMNTNTVFTVYHDRENNLGLVHPVIGFKKTEVKGSNEYYYIPMVSDELGCMVRDKENQGTFLGAVVKYGGDEDFIVDYFEVPEQAEAMKDIFRKAMKEKTVVVDLDGGD